MAMDARDVARVELSEHDQIMLGAAATVLAEVPNAPMAAQVAAVCDRLAKSSSQRDDDVIGRADAWEPAPGCRQVSMVKADGERWEYTETADGEWLVRTTAGDGVMGVVTFPPGVPERAHVLAGVADALFAGGA